MLDGFDRTRDRLDDTRRSGAEAVHEMVDWLNERGEKVGMLKVRLYRPFSISHFIEALPTTVQRIAEWDIVDEVVMTDIVEGLPQGLALDMNQSAAIEGFCQLKRRAW